MSSISAADVIEDLLDLDVNPKLLSKSITGIICARLIKRNCPQCTEPYAPDETVLDALGLIDSERAGPFSHGAGCNHCQHRGHLGRTLIYDCFEPELSFWDELGGANREQAILAVAARHGLITMREVGIRKALKGDIDVAELPQVLPSIYLPDSDSSSRGP
jgi:type II secretory ATPase GspE/PulE/Tfp pilus assembly ATPase PilB-like protein